MQCQPYLSDELLSLLGLVVEVGQDRPQEVPDERRLVVGRRVEGHERHPSNVLEQNRVKMKRARV